MHKFGIMGAMEEEIVLLKEKMNIKETKNIAGQEYYVGTLNDHKVVLVCCGVGKVNAASSTQILISEFKVENIINTGVAGALSDKLDIGDIVLSRDLTYHDVRQTQMKNLFPFIQFFEADKKLLEIAEKACLEHEELADKFHTGRIITGEQFIRSSEKKEQIKEELDGDCVEMESTAIAHVAAINKVPFLVIRSISDKANEKADVSFDEFVHHAAENSCKILCSILEKYEM